MNTKAIFNLAIITISAFAGCSLEPPVKGVVCHQMQYIYIDENTNCHSADECKPYTDIFDEDAIKAIANGMCPDQVTFECVALDENASICRYKNTNKLVMCDNNYIDPKNEVRFCGARGQCNSDDPNSADWHGENCFNGYCKDGTCIQQCETNDNCIIAHGSGNCEHNICEYECDKNYHMTLSGNTCEENTINNCGATDYNCANEVANWVDGSCSEKGKCIVSKCKNGYHPLVNEDDSLCEPDSLEDCGAHGHACNIVQNGKYTCLSGRCALSCDNNYHISSNGISCIPDSEMECGASRTNCRNKEGWESGNCVNGECMATSCNKATHYPDNGECKTCSTGFHLNADSTGCDEDSDKACGDYRKDCTKLEGWLTSECKDGYCSATKCDNEYDEYEESYYETNWCIAKQACNCSNDNYIYKCPFLSNSWFAICCYDARECAILYNTFKGAPSPSEVGTRRCEESWP